MTKMLTPSTSDAQLVGTWVGDYHAESAGNAKVKFCFFQLDPEAIDAMKKGTASALGGGKEALVGIYQTDTGAFGVITGEIEGNAFKGVAKQTTPGCTADFDMKGTVEGNTMQWNFVGTDCLGPEDGRGTAFRIL